MQLVPLACAVLWVRQAEALTLSKIRDNLKSLCLGTSFLRWMSGIIGGGPILRTWLCRPACTTIATIVPMIVTTICNVKIYIESLRLLREVGCVLLAFPCKLFSGD